MHLDIFSSLPCSLVVWLLESIVSSLLDGFVVYEELQVDYCHPLVWNKAGPHQHLVRELLHRMGVNK